jgi:hypothetical protein
MASSKKEYVEWITEAKREETRRQGIQTMLSWLAEGESRNWKYAHGARPNPKSARNDLGSGDG